MSVLIVTTFTFGVVATVVIFRVIAIVAIFIVVVFFGIIMIFGLVAIFGGPHLSRPIYSDKRPSAVSFP